MLPVVSGIPYKTDTSLTTTRGRAIWLSMFTPPLQSPDNIGGISAPQSCKLTASTWEPGLDMPRCIEGTELSYDCGRSKLSAILFLLPSK